MNLSITRSGPVLIRNSLPSLMMAGFAAVASAAENSLQVQHEGDRDCSLWNENVGLSLRIRDKALEYTVFWAGSEPDLLSLAEQVEECAEKNLTGDDCTSAREMLQALMRRTANAVAELLRAENNYSRALATPPANCSFSIFRL